jgi:hypothetical protein
MPSQTGFELEYLEERKRLLQQLLNCQADAVVALLRSELAELGELNARQLIICERLRDIQRALAGTGGVVRNLTAGAGEGLVTVQRSSDLKTEVVRLENEVGHRNRVFGALLVRARRTMDIFGRALASSWPTYASEDIARV